MDTDSVVTDREQTSATAQAGTYPRPQLVRPAWADLTGPWAFRHDDENRGLADGWASGLDGAQEIIVPFPPESPASGIGAPGFHPVVWYQRRLTDADLRDAGAGPDAPTVLLHFGAVDYRAAVWIDGALVGEHEGGQTPFTLDITAHVRTPASPEGHLLVVRAEDDPADVAQPRGKQDWRLNPHSIWYHRTTGIWQTVWIEAVPDLAVAAIRWRTDVPTATVNIHLRLRGTIGDNATAAVSLRIDGTALGAVRVPVTASSISATIALPQQQNGQAYEELLWSPEHPTLIDATIRLDRDDRTIDTVESYLGIRSVAVDGGAFLLNDRPYAVRSVLSQGYWPESHLAAPSVAALRKEVELIKELGFNAARVHQKVEDPRFLFWADTLGLLVWGEVAGAFEFTPLAATRLMREWIDVVERDVSHPSVVVWVPVNESWGVQHISHDPAQQAFARALADMTRALDTTRPVMTNDGWEHQNSDILSIHDYEPSGDIVRERYGTPDARASLLDGYGPAGRRLLIDAQYDTGQPLMLTEFGGISFAADRAHDDGWGYSEAVTAEDFEARLVDLMHAVHGLPILAGFCYTQLTDTAQETNGLARADRTPKLPAERIATIMRGQSS